ncbi:unnamed protein product [Cyprideis torosa]|uniref:Methylated-DNA--protein-cysteine methyltransferase n=1 Tax=Cyprideis torosa TaxID=163714 RepID=A0A7R8ZZ49_9CRUS|nr:unnamed protein product [Cyprideis torosa]CAG0912091.1 unnamed protein product [Cyprideis torosa]
MAETPFGQAQIAFAERGICHLTFTELPAQECEQRFCEQWPQAVLRHRPRQAAALLKEIFTPDAPSQPLKLWVSGSNFQIQVWRALLQIPVGGMASYRRVATMIDNPKASRAVGSAVAKNRIAFLIPCHRVLRGNGEAGEYHWGQERKSAMLGWEAAVANEGRS